VKEGQIITRTELDVFLQPRSVAVIGATERPLSWGSFIMEGLLAFHYPGKIYPVNQQSSTVYGIHAYPDVKSIPDCAELAVLTIPEASVEQVVQDCCEKRVQGITIVTAGFGEAIEGGRVREVAIAKLARAHGARVIGPNVSGTFNLHAGFNASPLQHLLATPLAGISQGGYAFGDLLASGYARRMGLGKFVHTGNECDLQVTDFLDYFGKDPQVQGIVMYVETLRDGRRFLEVAHRVGRDKPIILYKGGRTSSGIRAARSHTGAMAGSKEVYRAALQQVNVVLSPTMELLLPLGHALIERPPMRGKRVAIVTMGGSWGVALSDYLEEEGLIVPELSRSVQAHLRSLGMPLRAYASNPVDIGAAGPMELPAERLVEIGRVVVASGQVDALILHGLGRADFIRNDPPAGRRDSLEFEKQVMRGYDGLQQEFRKPVILGSHHSSWESQAISDLQGEGLRVLNRVDEIAQMLFRMYEYWRKIPERE
jgi:acyl-CoA synthetase (NDP forming)